MKNATQVTAAILLALFLVSCTKDETPSPQPAAWTDPNPVIHYSLAGETWVLSQYHDTQMTNTILTSDTLVFIDSVQYTWNGTPAQYAVTYYQNSAQYSWSFVLRGTPFGQLRANVAPSCITNGQITDKLFTGYPDGEYYLWLDRQ